MQNILVAPEICVSPGILAASSLQKVDEVELLARQSTRGNLIGKLRSIYSEKCKTSGFSSCLRRQDLFRLVDPKSTFARLWLLRIIPDRVAPSVLFRCLRRRGKQMDR